MAVINDATLSALKTTFWGDFQKGYDGATDVFYNLFCMEIASSTKSNTYGWMEMLPKMREWLGPRLYNSLKERSTVITNKDWEESIEVPRNDILDNNLGTYGRRFQMLGEQARRQPDYLFRDVLVAGESSLCFDGQNFFDTDHPVNIEDSGMGVQANLFTSKPLTEANFDAVLSAMQVMQGANGEAIGAFRNPMKTYLVVPPALKSTANKIVVARTVSSGGDNVFADTAKVVVIPELQTGSNPSSTTWYLIDGGTPVMPFVFQNRQSPEYEEFAQGSEHTFKSKSYLYGVNSRNNIGYGLYWMAAKVKAS